MYKIYINSVAVLLISTDQLADISSQVDDKPLVTVYIGKRKELLHVIDMCEKKSKYRTIIIHHRDEKTLIADFESLFIIQVAAGGLIKNELDQFLFIFRRGSWDLPKGKTEENETIEQTAIREVEEETGIIDVSIVKEIILTLHTFRDKKDRRVIKKSYWYAMSAPHQALVPQTEEDIELATWMELDRFIESCTPVYSNIVDVIVAYKLMNQPSI